MVGIEALGISAKFLNYLEQLQNSGSVRGTPFGYLSRNLNKDAYWICLSRIFNSCVAHTRDPELQMGSLLGILDKGYWFLAGNTGTIFYQHYKPPLFPNKNQEKEVLRVFTRDDRCEVLTPCISFPAVIIFLVGVLCKKA